MSSSAAMHSHHTVLNRDSFLTPRRRFGAPGRNGTRIRPLSSSSTSAAASATTTWGAPMSLPMKDVKEAFEEIEVVDDSHRALVLDVAYQTIDVVSWQRAVVLSMFDKVDVISYYDGPFALSANAAYYVPAVIKTREYNKKATHKTPRVSLHRKNIFIRDGFQCQYCGTSESLTVDHVVPQSRGGDWSWNNLVTSCAKCNNAKGDRLLHSIPNMALMKPPKAPTVANMCLYTKHGKFVDPPQEWVAYLPEYQIRRTSPAKGNPILETDVDAKEAKKTKTTKRSKTSKVHKSSMTNSR